jgi:lycopene cyclase domain-containing protein
MLLYLILELVIIIVPLILSFDRKMRFYRRWKSVFISIFLVGAVFVSWDVFFTRSGIWGFNPQYHASFLILSLPVEEWLFFIVVPYASIFIHYSLEFVHPKFILSDYVTRAIAVIIIVILISMALMHPDKTYTFTISMVTAVVTGYAATGKLRLLNRYFISFLVIIIPFLVFNGIWTGTFIKDEVFWYNKTAILGIRIFSIPFEDIIFAYCLILLVISCIHKVESIIGSPVQQNNLVDDNDDDD